MAQLLTCSGVARVQRLGGAKLISRVPSSSFPLFHSPLLFVPPPLSLLSDIFPPPFLSPSFLPKIQLEVWGALQAPPAGPGAEHFYHILRSEDVLVAMILVLSAQIKISIRIKIDRIGCYPPHTSYDYFS